jgi:indolepyruvate ferredoxin oxidoreductase
VLSPAGVQEILDYRPLRLRAVSRFAGVWVGLKLMKDTVEATAVVDGRPTGCLPIPDFEMPEGGLNIRLGDHWIAQEARLIDYKRFAAEAFGHANGIDRRSGASRARRSASSRRARTGSTCPCARSRWASTRPRPSGWGITTYKVGQTWPLDMAGFNDWAEGLDLIVVVEEKRKLIEVQIKEAIFDDRRGRRVFGYKDGQGEELFRPATRSTR